MNAFRIGCLSYVPLGYAVPQIPLILNSLKDHYQPLGPICVFEPDWGGFSPQDERYPDFSFFRFNRNNQSGRAHYVFSVEWLKAHKFDVLVVTHFKFLRWLVESGHRPRVVIFYNLENPCPEELPDAEDFAAIRRAGDWIDLILFTERHRQEQFYELCGLREVPFELVYNVPALHSCAVRPADSRNGRMIAQGTVDFRRTYVDYLCTPGRPPLPCDVFGAMNDGNASIALLDPKVSRAHLVEYRGLVHNDALAQARAEYAYSLVMWKPLSDNYYYACPNKFFESIASGVPPIVAPHPQCVEFVERYGLGIRMKDWSFASFRAATDQALDLLQNGGYAKLVEACLAAHADELNWERQFAKVAPHLPALPARAPAAPATEKRFFLVDPSLRDRMGHHYVYGQGCLLGAQREGYTTIALVNRMLVASLDGVDCLLPVFANDFWGRKLHLEGFGSEDAAAMAFVTRLAKTLGKFALTERDEIYIPNISDRDLEALAILLDATPGLVAGRWHIFIRHDLPGKFRDEPALPHWVRPALRPLLRWARKDSAQFPARVRSLQLLHAVLGSRLHLCTDTRPLATQHEWHSDIPFTVLPIPAAIEAAGKPEPNILGDGNAICVVYAGDARVEKGFPDLPAVISDCWGLIEAGKLRFRIHAYHPHGDSAVDNAKAALAARPHPNIEVIDAMLSDENYLALVRSANVLLVTYDPVAYHRRSSHVFIEAITNGKIPIVCRGSWMAGELPRGSAWVVESAATVGRALKRISANWVQHQQTIRQLSERTRQFHTARNLVKILAARNQP